MQRRARVTPAVMVGGEPCFDFCLSLRRGAQPLCCLDNRVTIKKGAQLRSGGGRLRVIAAWRSRVMRPDGGAAGESL